MCSVISHRVRARQIAYQLDKEVYSVKLSQFVRDSFIKLRNRGRNW